MPEADLYPPIKAFLEAQGYAVKGEIGPCDIVAVRGDEPPVVVELKERGRLHGRLSKLCARQPGGQGVDGRGRRSRRARP